MNYVRAVFHKHADAVQRYRPISGSVLEIGPGGNVGVAYLFTREGADCATCIDILPWAKGNEQLIAELGGSSSDLEERVEYRCPDAIESSDIPSESFDIVYSQACLEKVTGPRDAVRSIARILKPGGVTSHQIDLRDHRNFARPLEFLRYSDRTWRLMASRSNYTNRWRLSDWTTALAAAGLEILESHVTEIIPSGLIDRRGLHKRFARLPEEDLVAGGAFIVARKPVPR